MGLWTPGLVATWMRAFTQTGLRVGLYPRQAWGCSMGFTWGTLTKPENDFCFLLTLLKPSTNIKSHHHTEVGSKTATSSTKTVQPCTTATTASNTTSSRHLSSQQEIVSRVKAFYGDTGGLATKLASGASTGALGAGLANPIDARREPGQGQVQNRTRTWRSPDFPGHSHH